MKKVTGIGGIFFKCQDTEKMYDWYKKNLGIESSPYGASFEWKDAENPEINGMTQWSLFKESSNYFEPSKQPFMINYRVENLVELLEELNAAGVQILGEIQEYDYGKFVHILDPEGNKIELWQP